MCRINNMILYKCVRNINNFTHKIDLKIIKKES